MTTALTAIALGLLIGAVLGGLGGGGAILTVPALVYPVGQSAQQATAGSLVIVGLTAVVGALSYLPARRVRWATGVAFGLLGLPAAWLGSRLNARLDGDLVLLGFACLMLVAAAAMVADQRPESSIPAPASPPAAAPAPAPGAGGATLRTATEAPPSQRIRPVPLLLAGTGVGLLTGLFGVGGGFVIVPALVLALRLPMSQVVGTSLVIVALNSGSALLARIGSVEFDWSVVVPFTLAAMVAALLGKRVADRLPARGLKLGFALLMVVVALYTGTQSFLAL